MRSGGHFRLTAAYDLIARAWFISARNNERGAATRIKYLTSFRRPSKVLINSAVRKLEEQLGEKLEGPVEFL